MVNDSLLNFVMRRKIKTLLIEFVCIGIMRECCQGEVGQESQRKPHGNRSSIHLWNLYVCFFFTCLFCMSSCGMESLRLAQYWELSVNGSSISLGSKNLKRIWEWIWIYILIGNPPPQKKNLVIKLGESHLLELLFQMLWFFSELENNKNILPSCMHAYALYKKDGYVKWVSLLWGMWLINTICTNRVVLELRKSYVYHLYLWVCMRNIQINPFRVFPNFITIFWFVNSNFF